MNVGDVVELLKHGWKGGKKAKTTKGRKGEKK